MITTVGNDDPRFSGLFEVVLLTPSMISEPGPATRLGELRGSIHKPPIGSRRREPMDGEDDLCRLYLAGAQQTIVRRAQHVVDYEAALGEWEKDGTIGDANAAKRRRALDH